jgi:hypothetical protein
MAQMKPLSTDAVLLLVLAVPHIIGVGELVGALLIAAAGSYVLLDVLTWSNVSRRSLRNLLTLKLLLVTLIISLVVVLPMTAWMMLRATTASWQYIHDGAIQIEESVKYLLQLKNPYSEDYHETPLAEWKYAPEGEEEDPALYHNA